MGRPACRKTLLHQPASNSLQSVVANIVVHVGLYLLVNQLVSRRPIPCPDRNRTGRGQPYQPAIVAIVDDNDRSDLRTKQMPQVVA